MKTLSLLTLLLALGSFSAIRAHEPVNAMTTAATRWLDSLTPQQRQIAVYPLNDSERENWGFVPKSRAGLAFTAMTEAQQILARALLRSGLSQRGYTKAESIIELEKVLREIEKADHRDATLYYTTIFGTPANNKSWGWRFEGHHLSINVTIIDGHHVSVTPSFFGANPAKVNLAGPAQGTRALAEEEDLGRALVRSFTLDQNAKVILPTAVPRDIITGDQRQVRPIEAKGLPVAQMTAEQSNQLLALLKFYAHRHRAEIADAALAKIMTAGWEKVYFAWAGAVESGQPHYYRIQGPTFVIEYDNVQNKANHIHTVWRDFDGDFGRDLLREHHAVDHR